MKFATISLLMIVMVNMIGQDEVEVEDQEDDDGRGEAQGGHDQPLLQLHDD